MQSPKSFEDYRLKLLMPWEEKMAKGNRMCEHEALAPVRCSGEEWST